VEREAQLAVVDDAELGHGRIICKGERHPFPSLLVGFLSSIQYRIEVGVEVDGVQFRIKKEFRIVEPHTVRKEERIPQTKKVEIDAIV
jgi:hypothetical protein